MKVKQGLGWLLAVTLCLGLTACSGEPATSTTGSAVTTTSATVESNTTASTDPAVPGGTTLAGELPATGTTLAGELPATGTTLAGETSATGTTKQPGAPAVVTTTRKGATTTKPTTTTTAQNASQPTYYTPQPEVPVPAAARAAGMTKLAFSDDFDSYHTIDFSGLGLPGYNWYADRPYGLSTLTREEITIQDSVMTFAPKNCPAAIGLPTYSKKGKTGYVWKFGYAEMRMRFSVDEIGLRSEGRTGIPAFWGISVTDVLSRPWTRVGELDIFEAIVLDENNPTAGTYYTGALHDHWIQPDGTKRLGTNLANALGARGRDYLDNDWHTYAALWSKGYIGWYLDGKLMHYTRFSEDALPEYYYRSETTPLPRIEDKNPALADRTWVGAHTIMDTDSMVLIVGADKTWPIEVDWVRVWQKP